MILNDENANWKGDRYGRGLLGPGFVGCELEMRLIVIDIEKNGCHADNNNNKVNMYSSFTHVRRVS